MASFWNQATQIKIGVVLLHLLLASVLTDLDRTPSLTPDENAYALNIQTSLSCFESSFFCLPPTRDDSTKPFYIFAATLVSMVTGAETPEEIQSSLKLLHIFGIAGLGSLLQILLIPVLGLRSLIFIPIFYSSLTLIPLARNYGYAPLQALCLLGFYVILFSSLHRKRWQLFGAFLAAAALYTNINAIPFVIAATGMCTLWLIRTKSTTSLPNVIRLFSSLVLMCAFVEGLSWILNKDTYFNVFFWNFDRNRKGTYYYDRKDKLAFYLAIPYYFLVYELPWTLALIFGSFSRWIQGQEIRLPTRFPLIIAVSLLGLFFIEVSVNQKLLRSFYPAFIGYWLVLTWTYGNLFKRAPKQLAVGFAWLLFLFAAWDSFCRRDVSYDTFQSEWSIQQQVQGLLADPIQHLTDRFRHSF